VRLQVCVEIVVPLPHNANVHVQFQSSLEGSPPAGSEAGVCSVPFGSAAVPVSTASAAATDVSCWLTMPVVPGLRTRTDTFVFEDEDCEEPPMSLPLEETTLGKKSERETAAECPSKSVVLGSVTLGLSHVQSHVQFHVQFSEVGLPVCVEIEITFSRQSVVNIHVQSHGSSSGLSRD
jgi:hypothetical protein